MLLSMYDGRQDMYDIKLLGIGKKIDIFNLIKKMVTTESQYPINLGYMTKRKLSDIIGGIEKDGYFELNADISLIIKKIKKENYAIVFWRPGMGEIVETYECESKSAKRYSEIIRDQEDAMEDELNGSIYLYKIDYDSRKWTEIKHEYTK